jgi:GNAT superfamily N-acetyltransferase
MAAPHLRWQTMSCHIIEIDHEDPSGSTLFSRAYQELFIPAFPDPREREPQQEILDKLCLRRHGYYGRNTYRVIVMEEDGHPVGLCVFAYLSRSNAGVIEFLAVSPHCRGQGIGSTLCHEAEKRLADDAQAMTRRPLDWLLLEAHDPRLVMPGEDVCDPAVRIRFWEHQGFSQVDFPYVQPPLGDAADPVRKFLLMTKILNIGWLGVVPQEPFAMAVKEYAYWGFGIESPADNPYVREMLEAVARGKGGRRPAGGGREDGRSAEVRDSSDAIHAVPCLSVLSSLARQWRYPSVFATIDFKLNTG